MANAYHQIYIQTVFAVKYRNATINKEWKHDFFAVIGNLINENGCKNYIVNGVEDHVHCFFGFKPSLVLSKVVQSVKAKSSKWLNESGLLEHRFEWQKGYGAFSYSRSQRDDVIKYIQQQEQHHKHMTFQEECLKILDKFEVNYDEAYIFEVLK